MKKIFRKILRLPKYHKNPGLERLNRIIENRNLRPDSYVVIIGGTNGKGSVGIMLEKVLKRAGISVGAMRSPHVYDFCERFTRDGSPVESQIIEDAARRAFEFFRREEISPTFADVLTATALEIFTPAPPSVLLLEVGLGGRLDPVNAVKRDLTIITNVGHDHSFVLGAWPEEIAKSKAGIIKPGIPLITAESNPDALKIIEDECREKNASLIRTSQVEAVGVGYNGTDVLYRDNRYKAAMPGVHQGENTAIVLEALDIMRKTFNIPESAVTEGLKEARLPWRFEIKKRDPLRVFDGSHNREGWQNLADTLSFFQIKNLHVLPAILKTKNPEDFPRSFHAEKTTLHLSEIPGSSYHKPKELIEKLGDFKGEIKIHPSLREAVGFIINNTEKGDGEVFTGSFGVAKRIYRIVEEIEEN